MEATQALWVCVSFWLTNTSCEAGLSYADPRARMMPTCIFCFGGMLSLWIVGIGSAMMMASVTMLSTACAMAMLLRQTPLPVARGLHGPPKRIEKVIV